jgi:hypothetical protein
MPFLAAVSLDPILGAAAVPGFQNRLHNARDRQNIGCAARLNVERVDALDGGEVA